jgi:hypothetical protein
VAKLIEPVEPAPIPREQPHGFSGKKVTVEFLKTKDNEPRDIFVGVNEYQATIMRGRQVTIPVEVFEVLKEAKYTDQDEDPDFPDRKVWVEKQRYPYNVIQGPH